MSEIQTGDLFKQLFDTLDIAIESMPIRTGDIALHATGDLEARPQPAARPPPEPPARPVAPPPMPAPTPGPARPPTQTEIDAFFAQNAAYAEACKLLHAGNLLGAKTKLEPLARECPNVSEFQAAWSYVSFKLSTADGPRQEELRKLETIAAAYPSCASSRVFLSRVLIELDRVQTAVRYLKEATDLVPEREDVLAELRRANELLNQIRRGEEKRTDAPDGFREEADKKVAVQSVLVVIAAFGLMYGAFIIVGFGKDEQFRPLVQCARAGVLIFLGLGATLTFPPARKLEASDFQVTKLGAVAALLVGAISGAVMPGQVVRFPMALVLGLAVLRVVSEEVFFRLFLGRSLEKLAGAWRAPLLGGLFFGLYHLTFTRVWWDVEAGDGAMFVLVVTALAGIPYAFLHHRTRSIVLPLAAHLMVNLAAAAASNY